MTLIPFNINHCVLVKLTDYGRECMRKNYDGMCEMLTLFAEHPYDPPKEDAEGWSSWQLLDLMAEFGYFMYNGKPLIETEILIETEDAK